MLPDLVANRLRVRCPAGVNERLLRIERDRRADGAVSNEQLRKLRTASHHRFIVERTSRAVAMRGRWDIRARAVRQAPLGEREIAVLDGHLQVPACTRPVSPHVEHPPLRVFPVRATAMLA